MPMLLLGASLWITIFIWKMVSGSQLEQEKGLLIPLEGQVRFMFRVLIFRPLQAFLIATYQNDHNRNDESILTFVILLFFFFSNSFN